MDLYVKMYSECPECELEKVHYVSINQKHFVASVECESCGLLYWFHVDVDETEPPSHTTWNEKDQKRPKKIGRTIIHPGDLERIVAGMKEKQ